MANLTSFGYSRLDNDWLSLDFGGTSACHFAQNNIFFLWTLNLNIHSGQPEITWEKPPLVRPTPFWPTNARGGPFKMVWQWYNRTLTRHPLVTQCITTGRQWFLRSSVNDLELTPPLATLFATGMTSSKSVGCVLTTESDQPNCVSRWRDRPACRWKERYTRLCSYFTVSRVWRHRGCTVVK